MDRELFKRRLRMVRLLASGNSLHVVVETLSREFNCAAKVLYTDYERMGSWAPVVEQDKQLAAIIRGRLDLLCREAMDLMMAGGENSQLSVKEKLAKVGAINAVLKITMEQARLAQELGIIECKPLEVQETVVSGAATPFEADPILRQAIINSIEQQRAEKQAAQEALEKKKETAGQQQAAGAKPDQATSQANA